MFYVDVGNLFRSFIAKMLYFKVATSIASPHPFNVNIFTMLRAKYDRMASKISMSRCFTFFSSCLFHVGQSTQIAHWTILRISDKLAGKASC